MTWPVARSVADSIRTETVAPGVQLHTLVNVAAPWRTYVLDVDLASCVTVRSVKGAPGAEGRRTTTELFESLRPAFTPIAAVNADFFLFAPPGVPTNAHIEDGRMICGPIARPVFAMLANGARGATPFIGELTVRALVRTRSGQFTLTSWNRPTRNVPGIVDAAWGVALDSTITRPVRALIPIGASRSAPNAESRYVVRDLPLTGRGTPGYVARGDTLLLVESALSDAPQAPQSPATLVVRAGDTVQVSRTITPTGVQHAVGGQPVLLRDSVIVGAVDSVSNDSFRGVNPRTAVGVGANGRRLLLAVIDGRQAGYSAGTSLRATAAILQSLGARDAINLDGGGSSAMVVARDANGAGNRTVNKPSDAAGQRPVANALAVVRGCVAP